MAYRDDKEAAYARADALQRELDRTQAELDRTKGKLADTERARDSLAKRLTSGPKLPPPPLPTPQRRAGGAAIGSLFVIGAMSAFALNSSRHHYSPPPPPKLDMSQLQMPKVDLPPPPYVGPREFTLKSDPPGADVYVHRAHGDELVGKTPLTKMVADWAELREVVVKHDGFEPVSMMGMDLPQLYDYTAAETTIKLERSR